MLRTDQPARMNAHYLSPGTFDRSVGLRALGTTFLSSSSEKRLILSEMAKKATEVARERDTKCPTETRMFRRMDDYGRLSAVFERMTRAYSFGVPFLFQKIYCVVATVMESAWLARKAPRTPVRLLQA
ncbi:MAG: hypothetical protein IPM54_40580 [Polyangiaceae bacterium]|nr:hypothetical protein [Polyangiaceae bacterium]